MEYFTYINCSISCHKYIIQNEKDTKYALITTKHHHFQSFPDVLEKNILRPKLVYAVLSRAKVSVARVIEPSPYRLYGEFVCGDTSLTR